MTYLGSKVKYAKYIVPILQKALKNSPNNIFVDCCCGGCNIIKNINADKKIAIDSDKYLIALWQKFKDTEDFTFPIHPTKEEWDKAKTTDELDDWYKGLIKYFCSYFNAGFNSGFDKSDRYYGYCNTVKKDFPLIKDIEFINEDYHYLKNFNNVVIYIDPPYQSSQKTRTYDNGKKFDYNEFWDFVREISKTNQVFISEQTAPSDFEVVWSKEVKRMFFGKCKIVTENLYKYQGN